MRRKRPPLRTAGLIVATSLGSSSQAEVGSITSGPSVDDAIDDQGLLSQLSDMAARVSKCEASAYGQVDASSLEEK